MARTVPYVPPTPTGSTYHFDPDLREIIREGPAYIRTRLSTRWHRVRSAYHWIPEWAPDDLRTTYLYWCGAHAGKGPLLADEPPAGEPRCGTCEGRYAGHFRDERGWLFEPRLTDLSPKVCPGSATDLYAEIPDPQPWSMRRCLVCSDHVRGRALGSWWNGTWGLTRHAPGPGLIAPCEWHGWKNLTQANGAAMCRCARREG